MEDKWRPCRGENLSRPIENKLVWIFDGFYHGVTLGRYSNRTGWVHYNSDDDISVWAWKPLECPTPPPIMIDPYTGEEMLALHLML